MSKLVDIYELLILMDEVTLEKGTQGHIQCHCPAQREAEKNKERMKAYPGLHDRMTEKDRVRKQIKKHNASELTEKQREEKRER